MYAVVDIETTGGKPKDSRITEIAIVITDGKKVIKTYESLVNPERKIDFYVTRLTGIDNKMVESAPKFYEIAKEIVEHTEGMTFVAHNVGFDYSHIKREFAELGYEFKRDTVCTVQLSRKVFPDEASYSLGKLTKSLGIVLNGHHRAMNDAVATTDLLHLLLEEGKEELASQRKNNILYERLSVNELPNKTGIYYFRNTENEIIYIGKSKNIRQRVKTHLANYSTKKGQKIIESISSIDFLLLGSELISLLKESDEIKSHAPIHNRQQRKRLYPWAIYAYQGTDNYLRLTIAKTTDSLGIHIKGYQSKMSAQSALFGLNEKYNLCQSLNGLYKTTKNQPCFHYTIDQCKGACIKEESFNDYNCRVQQLIDDQEIPDKSFYILDKGRSKNERSCIKVENGKYIGFGFFDNNFRYNSLEDLDAFIEPHEDTKDARTIIRSFIQHKKVKKIIPFSE